MNLTDALQLVIDNCRDRDFYCARLEDQDDIDVITNWLDDGYEREEIDKELAEGVIDDQTAAAYHVVLGADRETAEAAVRSRPERGPDLYGQYMSGEPKTMAVSELRAVLGDRVAKAHHAGDITVITKNGRPQAVLISYEHYQQLTDTTGGNQ